MDVRKKIKKYLFDNNMSQRDFVAITGISPTTLSRFLAKKVDNLHTKNLKKIMSIIPLNDTNETNLEESNVIYGENWRDKYYQILEKYNSCLEEKEALKKKFIKLEP